MDVTATFLSPTNSSHIYKHKTERELTSGHPMILVTETTTAFPHLHLHHAHSDKVYTCFTVKAATAFDL